jgi:ABC-type multidrug transport system fused ATPase/permease subunit
VGSFLNDGVNIKDYSLHVTLLEAKWELYTQEPLLFNDTMQYPCLGSGTRFRGLILKCFTAEVLLPITILCKKKRAYTHNIGDRGSKLSEGRQRLTSARAV